MLKDENKKETSPKNIENKEKEKRNSPKAGAVQAKIAFTIVGTFALLCLAVLFIPDAKSLNYLIPFVAPAVMLVLNYYFGRDENNK